MKNKIKIFAPGTVSNVGSGYDIMGFAFDGPGDILELELNGSGEIRLENRCNIDIPLDYTNVVYPCVRHMLEKSGIKSGLDVRFLQKIMPGSGIGSSAASSVAAVFGLNKLLGNTFTQNELIDFAMEGEKLVSGQKHADNVAPCLMGGFTLIRSYNPLDIVSIPFPDDLFCTVVHPEGIKIKTSDSRKLVKNMIPIRDTITQTGNASSLIAGLILNNKELIGRSAKDVLAEPLRLKLIPYYDEMKREVKAAGALTFNISGSGPSVFSFSDSRDTAKRVGTIISRTLANGGFSSNTYISTISLMGAREIS